MQLRDMTSWIAGALAGVLLLAGAAGAVVLKGRGELIASGNGLAVLELRGKASVRGLGLVIVDEHAVVDAQGHGRSTRLGDGRVLFEGFGVVSVRSLRQRTRVEAAGAKLRLRAQGSGVALLKGTGHFLTDDVDGRWGAGVTVEFQEEG
jgi:hypothetical protein